LVETKRAASSLLKTLMELGEQKDGKTDVSGLERDIDERVYRLYGLTKDEIAMVEDI
jgi:hypothetical protein